MQITDSSPHATDAPRGTARRQQILNAAAQCFREHGFHGASIAQISKTAGMSAGHIYHYFENKEAIIAAIVAEAARNPRVAQIVREADATCRSELAVTIRAIRQAAGHDDSPAAVDEMVEILASLFEGLLLRTIRNPALDRARVAQRIQIAINDLLDQPG